MTLIPNDYEKGINEAFEISRKEIDALKAENKELKEQLRLHGVMHWVAVDERLPNEHQDVMVYYYGNRNSKHFPNLQFIKQSSFYNGRFECDEKVTHWAILPEPPCE